MVIKGRIEKIIYRNADNGYTVLLLESGNKLVSCVGVMPPMSEDSEIEVAGEIKTNGKYGEQLEIHSVHIIMPTDKESMVRYLASGLFYGIGQSTAESIVATFGTDTFNVIRDNPNKLAKAKNVSRNKAVKLHEQFINLEDMQEAVVYLQGLDISLNLGLKIFKKYGKATRNTVMNNPYCLVEDIDGVGFYTADKIAATVGVPRDSEFRIKAGVQYVLKSVASNNGHSYLPKNELLEQTAKLLQLEINDYEEKIANTFSDLEIGGKIIIIERDGEQRVMFSRYYATERNIALRLIGLANNEPIMLSDIERECLEYERIAGITLHENQKIAIDNSIKSAVNVITGGPGTGKTTIIKCVIAIFKGMGLRVQICAPTGRAAKRLSESTGEDAKTIHRLLDLDFKDGKGFFTYNENTKLEADVVIVDEVSMCDEYVFNALVTAIPRGGRLIMVGDKDQLPSVGIGNVLADIIGSGIIPVSYLTHIYRQSEESLIIENAHRINKGVMPILRNQNSDFLFNAAATPVEVKDTCVSLVTERIPKYLGVKPSDIQVLCPLKRGVAGANNLNVELQRAINPPMKNKGELVIGDTVYRMGDKVIHVVNNYEMEWTRNGEEGKGVFNGDIGFITYADKDGLSIEFDDGREADYTRDEARELLLAYAISVHKSQGSEFDVVLIALTGGAYTILTRNLLYTAVTRAKKMSVIVGDTANLQKMVRNNYTAKRYTMLKEMLLDEQSRRRYK